LVQVYEDDRVDVLDAQTGEVLQTIAGNGGGPGLRDQGSQDGRPARPSP
jgi:hypothetical protein